MEEDQKESVCVGAVTPVEHSKLRMSETLSTVNIEDGMKFFNPDEYSRFVKMIKKKRELFKRDAVANKNTKHNRHIAKLAKKARQKNRQK